MVNKILVIQIRTVLQQQNSYIPNSMPEANVSAKKLEKIWDIKRPAFIWVYFSKFEKGEE